MLGFLRFLQFSFIPYFSFISYNPYTMSSTSYTLDMISCTSKTYDEISALVHKGMRSSNKSSAEWCIVSIDRVKNPYLEGEFAATKAAIAAKRGEGAVKEVRAFHGTTEAGMAGIVAQGFDPTRNQRSMFGKGTYVAPSASFARSYAQETHMGDNVMILCRVALGVPTQGCVGKEINTALYDYAVDSLKNPNMYVIPYTHAVIPEYVVQFYGKARM